MFVRVCECALFVICCVMFCVCWVCARVCRVCVWFHVFVYIVYDLLCDAVYSVFDDGFVLCSCVLFRMCLCALCVIYCVLLYICI